MQAEWKMGKEITKKEVVDAYKGEVEEGFEKPGFDARLSFNRQVERYLMGVQSSMLNRRYDDWHINLWGLWSLFNPYIKRSDSARVKGLLRKAQQGLSVSGRNSNFFKGKAVIFLQDANELLIMSGKHLLMPLGEEGITEFDENQFMRMANTR